MLRGYSLLYVGHVPQYRGGDQSHGGLGIYIQNGGWVKKNPKSGGNFWGLGAYTRANAEVCLLGVTPDFKARDMVKSHRVHQIIEAPFEGHSKKPDEARRRIVELLGDVPRIELFARQRADGWDAWGTEAPAE